MSDSKKKIYLGEDLVCQTFTDAEEQAKAFDLFGLEQPVVSSNAPASTRPVQQGQVCELDGVNDYVNIDNEYIQLEPSETIDAEFMVFLDSGATVDQSFLHCQLNGGSYKGYTFKHDALDDALEFAIINGAGTLKVQANPIAKDTWVAVRVTYDGSTNASGVAMWVNGDSVALTIVTDTLTAADVGYTNNYNVSIGAWVYSNSVVRAMTGKIAYAVISGTYNLQYNLNHASGTTAYDSSGNGNDGTLQNGAAFVVDNTLPPEADKLNLEGFSKATVLSAVNSRVRFNTGVISTFEASKIRIGWYQPYEITAASSVKTLCSLNTTNGAMTVKLGSSTSLATDETLTFNGSTNSRTYIRDDISAGYHVVEIVSTGSNTWDIYLDGVLMAKYTHSASPEKTVNQVWVGPSLNGSDGVAGSVFQEFKIWDDSDVLQVDVDMENSDHTNLVGGESPSSDSGSIVMISRDESNPTLDIFGNSLQYSGSVYPRRPEYRNSYAASFDGVDDYISAAHLTGSETVTSSVGASTPSISAGRIDFTAGTCSNLILSDGTQYPLTEGAGDTAHDISGNGNHGTINNASTATEGAGFWAGRIDGEANALNNNNGFSRRMLFDGVDDSVNLGNSADFDFTNNIDITLHALIDDNTNSHEFVGKGTGTTTNWNIDYNSGIRFFGYESTVLKGITASAPTLTNNTKAKIRCTFNGTTWKIYVDDVEVRSVTDACTLTTNSNNVLVGERGSASLSGTMYDISINGVATYTGNGNTDADWTDQIGSNDGTVNGSPALLRIPADTSDPTKDVYGDTLTNPAITDGYNGAETELDAYNIAEGDNPSPATNNNPDLESIEFGADFASNDAAYMRLKSSTENDRLITFADDLTGGDETLAQKYTQ